MNKKQMIVFWVAGLFLAITSFLYGGGIAIKGDAIKMALIWIYEWLIPTVILSSLIIYSLRDK